MPLRTVHDNDKNKEILYNILYTRNKINNYNIIKTV